MGGQGGEDGPSAERTSSLDKPLCGRLNVDADFEDGSEDIQRRYSVHTVHGVVLVRDPHEALSDLMASDVIDCRLEYDGRARSLSVRESGAEKSPSGTRLEPSMQVVSVVLFRAKTNQVLLVTEKTRVLKSLSKAGLVDSRQAGCQASMLRLRCKSAKVPGRFGAVPYCFPAAVLLLACRSPCCKPV